MNAYEILGLSTSASESEVKASYRKLSMLNHPDRHLQSLTANQAMSEINRAYQHITSGSVRRWVSGPKVRIIRSKEELNTKKSASLNPQNAINKMVKQAAEAGYGMVYQRSQKIWSIGGKLVTPQQLAAIRASGFQAWMAENL